MSFLTPFVRSSTLNSSIFPPAPSSEPALTAAEWLGGKNARPKMIDLETNSISSSSAPIPAAPTKSASTPAPAPAAPAATPAPTRSETAPAKSEPAPASSTTAPSSAGETKPLTPPKAESPTPARAPEQASEQSAKDLEIQQPEEPSDDEADAPAAAVATVSTPAPNGSSVVAVRSSRAMHLGRADGQPKDHLLIKRLSDFATLPTRGSPLSAGYDLYAAEKSSIPKRSRALIDLQISIACPEGTYGRIAPRSGLAVKHGINTGAGVIDADYRGPVKVLLFNNSDEDFEGESAVAG